MTQQDYLQQYIGQLVLQVATLQAELDKVKAMTPITPAPPKGE